MRSLYEQSRLAAIVMDEDRDRLGRSPDAKARPRVKQASEPQGKLRSAETAKLNRAVRSLTKHDIARRKAAAARNIVFDNDGGVGAPEGGKDDGARIPVSVKETLERYSPKGRKLRKAFERPRPDLPADALVNRIRKVMSLSLPSELIEEVTAEARSQGLDRSAFVERALRAALSRKPKLTP